MSAPSEAVSTKPDEDPDGDGLTNQEEAEMGANPWNPDTDGDGVPDGQDGWAGGSDPALEKCLAPKRLPKPHFATIDMGEGYCGLLSNAGTAVIINASSDLQKPYSFWKDGTLTVIASPDPGKHIMALDMSSQGDVLLQSFEADQTNGLLDVWNDLPWVWKEGASRKLLPAFTEYTKQDVVSRLEQETGLELDTPPGMYSEAGVSRTFGSLAMDESGRVLGSETSSMWLVYYLDTWSISDTDPPTLVKIRVDGPGFGLTENQGDIWVPGVDQATQNGDCAKCMSGIDYKFPPASPRIFTKINPSGDYAVQVVTADQGILKTGYKVIDISGKETDLGDFQPLQLIRDESNRLHVFGLNPKDYKCYLNVDCGDKMVSPKDETPFQYKYYYYRYNCNINNLNRRFQAVSGKQLWQNFKWETIPDDLGNGLTLNSLKTINDRGTILASAKAQDGKTHAVLLLPVDIAVDANRDGVIKFAGNYGDSAVAGKPADVTTQDKPFRFWINDDNDSGEQDHPGSNAKDSDSNTIVSLRDLEDFTRLHLNIGGLQDGIADGTITVGLEWRNATGSPSIKVFQAAEVDGGDQYLKTDVAAGNQKTGTFGTALGTVSNGGSFKFPASFWQSNLMGLPKLDAAHPNRYLLFEGVTEGKGQLVLTFWKGSTRMGEGGSLWMDLMNIKKMYQSSEGDMLAGAPLGESEQTVVCVHGWNMSPDGSRNYAETMFKRLWHRGFKGRFAYFRWNTYWITATDVIGTLTTQYFANYNNSEYIAWTQGAPALKSFVESLPYESKNIAAHSMGNIVVGEAMRLGMHVNNYALMQPAVPAACYDEREVLKQTSTYQHSFLGVNVTMWDEASPDDDPDDATRNMAYRGMLKDIGQNGNLILFYLPNDAATSNAWELNNDLTKPSGTLSGQFRYDRNGQPGQKLYRDFGGGIHEYSWASRRESATFACRTWGKAAGADGRTQGAISEAGRVDLSGPEFALPGETEPGFGDEHSGQFTARIQQLKPFYDELMFKLNIGTPNP